MDTQMETEEQDNKSQQYTPKNEQQITNMTRMEINEQLELLQRFIQDTIEKRNQWEAYNDNLATLISEMWNENQEMPGWQEKAQRLQAENINAQEKTNELDLEINFLRVQ